MLKKKIWASFQRIIELFAQKFFNKALKNMGLGSGIRDPGSGKNLFRIPDPGSRGQKGTGSRIRIRNTDSNSVRLAASRMLIMHALAATKCKSAVFCTHTARLFIHFN